MKINKLLFFFILLPSITIAADTIPKDKQCTTNADCVLVQSGCCNCNNGGQKVAINSQSVSEWDKANKSHCESTMCPAMVSVDPSCAANATAVCQAGACTIAQDIKGEKS